ncbi:hypothetical protein Rfer_4457 (plasmid) [Rhodoferax ferrireducens T118]|uniref:Uncharacterized protein n=1 Tax=Albidiferax ferrireducens (strain ATCC BAA-621 / DSM 15236 / T118) TaxID=338969 RepID=Q21Q02_ALBFT|nr:hypothetical protein [Rhodoferax ferrireducens]ABD72143.1 hypothetical protein Rfer_4457 [Rhodoferax ferrireducens T118]
MGKTKKITDQQAAPVAMPTVGELGFYGPDPSGTLSPNVFQFMDGPRVHVLALRPDMVLKIDLDEWMSLESMKASTLEQCERIEDEMTRRILKGRIAALVDALDFYKKQLLIAQQQSAVTHCGPDLTPRQIEAGMKPRCPKPGEVERLYAARDRFVAALKEKGSIELNDLEKLDRMGRFKVAEECWGILSAEARQALLDDAHHQVRACAAISWRDATKTVAASAALPNPQGTPSPQGWCSPHGEILKHEIEGIELK